VSAVACIAKLSSAPGKRAELAAALQVALDHVEQEPGTRYYLLHEDAKDADVLWMYELYEGQADFDAHRHASWMAELGPSLAPLLGGRPELTFLTPIGGKGL
jgi:quinol monooxygenase YgiN